MNTPMKLGLFAAGLVIAFGAAAGVGNAIGPIGSTGEIAQHGAGHAGADTTDSTAAHGAGSAASTESGSDEAAGGAAGDHAAHGSAAEAAAEEIPEGLMLSQHGYTLALAQVSLPAGEAVPFAFQVLGPDGSPVTSYEQTHDKDLHLIAVRRDMTDFQHVHPELAEDGTWKSSLDLTAGQWRVFADFAPTEHGQAMTLGVDLAVAGDYDPQPLPEPAAAAGVDGYTVTLDGELRAGRETELTLSVSRDGQPVTDLQPYLAAYGHLVALRDGDLAYLHVHPAGAPGDGTTEPGPDITFYATAPSRGDYRLFLDFQHEGVVRTAEFTAAATASETEIGHGDQTGSDDHSH